MKKILIATDFSEDSRFTIQQVLNHVKDVKNPCEIILLNTFMVNESDPKFVINTNDRLKVLSKSGLEIEKQKTINLVNNPHITVSTASHMGSLNNVILQYLKNDQIDLVAMSKSDGKNIDAIAKIMRDRNCSLLVTELPEDNKELAI